MRIIVKSPFKWQKFPCFSQKAISDYRDRYNISWSVQSFSPIREYRLFYRKQTPKSYMMTQQIQQHLDKSYENAIGSGGNGAQHHYSPPYATGLSDQWENVVIPENFQEFYPSSASSFNINDYRHSNQHFMSTHHHMSYLIRNLQPAANYEARVQARNDHGWNKLSNVFHFSSRTEGECLKLFKFIAACVREKLRNSMLCGW